MAVAPLRHFGRESCPLSFAFRAGSVASSITQVALAPHDSFPAGTRLALRDSNMRVPILWLAFWLLFAFWFAAFFLHLHGGVTTYTLLVVAIAWFLKRGRLSAR
jgi:hypothetical protein